MMTDFGECRSLLALPPSGDVFEQIVDLLGDCFEEVDEALLAYVEGHVRRWPREVRRQIPDMWLDSVCYAHWNHPGLRLCNAFKHDEHDHHAPDDLIKAFHISELTNLIHFDFGSHYDGLEILQAIAKPECSIRPESIALGYIYFGIDTIKQLSDSSNFSHLQSLDLRYCNLRDAEVIALATSSTLHSLRELKLQGNRITQEGIQALASSKVLANLETLDLRLNRIGAIGAQALAESEHLTNLQWLLVYGRNVGYSAGAKALSESAYLNPDIRRFWRYHANRG